MSGPNLSQYFTNDPPSPFDVIGASTPVDVPFRPDVVVGAAAGSYAEVVYPGDQQQPAVTDDVKDCWEPAHVEPGIPPILTMPGVLLATELSDPISDTVVPFLGEVEARSRKMLAVTDVTQDERGLQQLIKSGSYRSAINLTNSLLTIYGQGFGRVGQPAKHSPHSLQLWFTRFALLLKLGMAELCLRESEPFGLLNKPDVYFEFYPEMYNGRKGSMAPFSLRLLLAELPLYLGQPKVALDRLTDVYLICSKIANFHKSSDATAHTFWQRREMRVVHSLVNCTLQMKDFNLADTLIDKLVDNEQLVSAQRKALFSAWGRIYLQCGDVFGAERKFSEARRIRDTSSSSEMRDTIDKGLIAVAQNDFKTAHSAFENALKLEPNNSMLLNNLGVCSLYSGHLKEAIRFFERAVQLSNANGLCESMLLNLSTLYELESSNDVAKKLELLRHINKHPSDMNINLEFCLKLQPVQKIY